MPATVTEWIEIILTVFFMSVRGACDREYLESTWVSFTVSSRDSTEGIVLHALWCLFFLTD